MKKLLFTLALLFAPTLAWGQCNGVYLPGQACGSAAGGVPGPINIGSVGTISILTYGAKCDGSTDDTVAIQAAINALPVSGGDVIFPGGLGACKVTSSLNIGNGTSSTASTRYGVHLRGQGSPIFPFSAGYPTVSAAKILWAGGSNPVIQILGPLQGWGLHNLYIDCASTALQGLKVQSGQFGDTDNLTLSNCQQGLASVTVAAFGALTNTDSLHNSYRNLNIQIPGILNSFGILLSGTATTNTDFNTFINTFITMPSSVATFGIYLQASDSNTFYNTQISGGSGSSAGVTFDYTVANVWPASNGFYGIDNAIPGTQYVNTGAIGGGASPNWIYGLVKTNGAADPNIANLTLLAPDAIRLCGSTGNTGCINFNTQTSFTGYNFNWPITAGTTGQLLTSAGGGASPMTWTAPGLSTTKTVRAAGGAADCTLIFTGGLLTGGTC